MAKDEDKINENKTKKHDEKKECNCEKGCNCEAKEEKCLHKKSEISELEIQNSELIDLLQRKQAEFENYRKRIEREQSEFSKHATDKLVADLLEVLDNFSLALKHGLDEKGVQMIYEQFVTKLKKIGVEEFSMLGKKFDPCVCEAVAVIHDNSKDDCAIVDELGKGYKVHDRILRCAKVVINKKENSDDKKNIEEKN